MTTITAFRSIEAGPETTETNQVAGGSLTKGAVGKLDAIVTDAAMSPR